MEQPRHDALRAAYESLLAKRGLDLAFRDKAPVAWPEVFPGDSFDPRGAAQAIRMLENDRRYTTFTTVGTEPEANFLYRLATVGSVGGPYQGEGLPRLQECLEAQMSELRQWLEEASVRLPYPVFAGVFPTGEFNARAFPVAGAGALLLVNSGLMDLLFTVLKTNLASSFGPDDPPLLTDRQVAMVLAEAFNAYMYSESSVRSMALPALPPGRGRFLGYVLRRGEQFVLAHELGHVSLGHVPLDSSSGHAHTPEEEKDADRVAVNLLATSLDSPPTTATTEDDASFLAGAIMNVVHLAHAINLLSQELGIEQRDSTTHPGLDDRAKTLAQVLERNLPGENPLRRASVFSNWLSNYMPSVLKIINRVNAVMVRPPFVRNW